MTESDCAAGDHTFGKIEFFQKLGVVIEQSDGTETVITRTDYLTVHGYDSSKFGTQTVTVNCGQYSDTFEVQVVFSWWQWILKIFSFGLLFT